MFNKSQSDMLAIEVLPTISADSIGYVKLTNEDKVTLEMKYNEMSHQAFLDLITGSYCNHMKR